MSQIFLNGLLLPGDFGPMGECSSIHLCTCDERVYPVTAATAGLELECYLRKKVRITGELQIIDGNPQVMVLAVKPLSD